MITEHPEYGVVDVALHPYQQRTINRIHNSARNIVVYARQMGLTLTLLYLFVEEIDHNSRVLFLTPNNSSVNEIKHRLKMNNSLRNSITVMSSNSKSINIAYYDYIIVDNAGYVSNSTIEYIHKNATRNQTVVLASNGMGGENSAFRCLAMSNLYSTTFMRRFICPDTAHYKMKQILGDELYRREYELR